MHAEILGSGRGADKLSRRSQHAYAFLKPRHSIEDIANRVSRFRKVWITYGLVFALYRDRHFLAPSETNFIDLHHAIGITEFSPLSPCSHHSHTVDPRNFPLSSTLLLHQEKVHHIKRSLLLC